MRKLSKAKQQRYDSLRNTYLNDNITSKQRAKVKAELEAFEQEHGIAGDW